VLERPAASGTALLARAERALREAWPDDAQEVARPAYV
jgi:hypothetical protein